MRLLIANDGSRYSDEAAGFARLLMGSEGTHTTLLGVAEEGESELRLRTAIDELADDLSLNCDCTVDVRIRRGFAPEQIMDEAAAGDYDLVVVGARGGGRLRRFVMGRTTRRLLRHVSVPLLIVSHGRPQLDRILVCTAGMNPGVVDTLVAARIAVAVGADLTVLHVMSQIALTDEAPTEYLDADAETILQSDVREGEHLRHTLAIMAAQGLASHCCEVRVRHGLVLDEILSETREGGYDLVVIGAHSTPENTRHPGLRTMLQDNMAARILKNTRRPVLVVNSLDPDRYGEILE